MSANVFRSYPGDQRNYSADHYVGCNGKFYRPVGAEFDGTNTVIELEPVPLDQMGQLFGDKLDQAIDAARISELFGGALR